MANKIQIKRGLKADLPILDSGESGFCTDTKEIFIGDGTTNYQILTHNKYDANTILAATLDNTPVAITIDEQRIVGRKTSGNITALTNAEIMAILSGGAGADFSINNKKITNLANGTNAGDAVNKGQLDGITSAADAMIFKGTVGTSGTYEIAAFNSLATYSIGWTYKVITAGTIKGKVCEIGDMIISIITRAGSGNLNEDWMVVQSNIDGAVIGPTSAVDARIATFNGVTGKIIQDGGKTISELAISTHVHGNITNVGAIGSTAGLLIVTGTSGVLTALAAGTSTQFMSYNGTWATPPNDNTATAVDDILDGSNNGTAITYSAYTTSQAADLKFYTHATNPTGTSRLNIGGYFYATRLYDDGARVHNVNSTIDGGAFV